MKPIQSIGAVRALFIALLLLPAMAHARHQPFAPVDTLLSLDNLLTEIRAGNPSLRVSRLEAEALATRSRQASAFPDPAVSVGYQPYSLLTARGAQRSQWRIEQMAPYPGKRRLQGAIADLNAEVAGFEADAFEEDLLFEAKQAYYELYRIQRQEKLILAFQGRLENFEEAAAAQYEVGAGMQQAILKAQLEKNALVRERLELAERRRTATETLTRLLNRPASGAFTADIRIEAPSALPLDEAALLAIALRERPETRALDAATRRADARIALARKAFMPDFGLSLTYFDIGRADAPPTATGRDAVAIGATIKVPVQRGGRRARLEETRVRRIQAETRREALETSFRTQIADLASRLRGEARQLALYREALIPQAETTLQATLSAYTTGRTDFLDLLDAERMLFSLETGYEDTFARYLKTTAALERALGIRSLADLDTL